MSSRVEVTCAICGESIGDQLRPGGGFELFITHGTFTHPDLSFEWAREPVEMKD